MNLSFDTVIAGFGLAGACAARVVSENERVLLLEADAPGAGASGISAGLISPLMARRARPVWRVKEAVIAMDRMLEQVGAALLKSTGGLIKPARDPEQASEFKAASEKWPEHGVWYDAEESKDRWPYVETGYGALLVRSGGAIRTPELLQTLRTFVTKRGAEFRNGVRILGWREEPGSVTIQTDDDEIRAGRLILAIGAGYLKHSSLQDLHLHPIKGQWIRIQAPAECRDMLPISGRGYVAFDGDALVIGSTYEHTFSHLEPTLRAGGHLLENAARMIPALEGSTVLNAGAAVRVTVPGIRLPMVGLLPGLERTWIFTGLGSKGLMLAPLLAEELPGYIRDPESIPKEIRVAKSR